MNYGTPDDWKYYTGILHCDVCRDNTANRYTMKCGEDRLGANFLCDHCYQKLVVTPNLQPLTKEDLTDDLVGKEVVCVNDKAPEITKGISYQVIKSHHNMVMIYNDKLKKINYICSRFALPAEAQAPQTQECRVAAPFPSQPEITHSCELEFPNGKTVTVPGPEGPEWKAETLIDAYTPYRTRKPKAVLYDEVTNRVQVYVQSSVISGPDESKNYEVNHSIAQILLYEYRMKIDDEEPDLTELTKWTRDPNYQPPGREETFEERARRRYPSRMRG